MSKKPKKATIRKTTSKKPTAQASVDPSDLTVANTNPRPASDAEFAQPPDQVAAAIAPRQPGVAADREIDAPTGAQHIPLKLRYQACNNEVCLPPVTLPVDAAPIQYRFTNESIARGYQSSRRRTRSEVFTPPKAKLFVMIRRGLASIVSRT